MNDKILERVRKLLAQANHPNTGEAERAAFLAKANEMMVQHAIDEAVLAATQPADQRRKPVVVTSQMYDPHTVWGQKFRTIMNAVCSTARVRVAGGGLRGGVFTMVGYSDDVEYASMLFTTIQFAFVAKIQPTFDPALGLDANIYAFREAGYKWEDVARFCGVEWPDQGLLGKAHRRHCAVLGVKPSVVTRHTAYRESFAEAFVDRMCSRLEEMREAAAKQSVGSELVLYHAQEEVDDEFYKLYPNARPLTKEQLRAERKRLEEEELLEREKHQAWLDSLTPAQRLAHERRVQEQADRDARADDRYWREVDRRNAKRFDSAGSRAGRSAADSVNLARVAPAASHQTKGQIS